MNGDPTDAKVSAAPKPTDQAREGTSETLPLGAPVPATSTAQSTSADDDDPNFDPGRFGIHHYPPGHHEALIAKFARRAPPEQQLHDTLPPLARLAALKAKEAAEAQAPEAARAA